MDESNIGPVSSTGETDAPPEVTPEPVASRRGRFSRARGTRRRRFGLALPASKTDRILVGATLVAVVGVVTATISVLPEVSTQTAVAADLPTLAIEPPTTTTTAPPTTTTVPVAAPAPETAPVPPPPPKAAAQAIVQVGEIRIPKIGLVHNLYEGVTLNVINKGPGHWPGSAMPGQLGNAVFAGHRTTYSKPFNRINELVPGDEISFQTADGVFTYTMTRFEIVKPSDVWIVDPTPDATITLFACHPPGSARQRYVIRGTYLSSSPA